MDELFTIDTARVERSAAPDEAAKPKWDGKKFRAEQRKLKRQAKSEAKKARKLNVKPSAKWTGERKADEKAKKLANKPQKQERKRQRLLARAHKLEIQAKKFLADSKKAKLLYEQLTKAKEEAEAAELENGTTEIELIGEEQSVAKGLDEDATSSVSDSSSSDGSDPPPEPPALPVPADEVALKRRSESDAGSVIDITNLSTEPTSASSGKKKKDKKDKTGKKTKSSTKSSLQPNNAALDPEASKEIDGVMDLDVDDAAVHKVVKEKKRKRDRQSDVEGETTKSAKKPRDSEVKDKKKEKKSKKDKKTEKLTETAAVEDEGENWNVGDLNGGSERQDKFLRLLGGKKAEGGSIKKSHHKGNLDSAKTDEEIERQFEAGMKMKNEGGNHRRGLGA